MQLPDDFEEQKKFSPALIAVMLGVAVFAVGIFLLVLALNQPAREEQSGKGSPFGDSLESPVLKETGEATVADLGGVLTGSTLSPEDLDFWDKYPESEESEPAATPEPSEEPQEDPSTDGKHTLVTNADGEEEWVLISPYLPKHEYDFTKLVCQSDRMKYFSEGKQISYVGADISKLQDYVDFTKVKKDGLDFVMVRVGARGYSSGQLVMDDYFTENVKRASDAGLQVGVYFFSQAITTDEALEEANLVLDSIKDYNVTYPVAFYMDEISGDTSRIDKLSRAEKTDIAKTFLDAVQGAGYLPMLCGDKEWLLKQVDLSKLTDYDIWLNQIQDVPDYPYKFSMWQYSVTGSVDGISGYANLDISFIDYSEK